MSRRLLPISVGVLLLVLAVSGRARDEKPAAPAAKEIERLIHDLSADEFDVREAATRKLTDLGEAAASAVEKATKSADAETSRRAGVILQEVQKRRDERELKELLANLDKTPLDKLIAHITKNPERVTDAEWKALGKLVEATVSQTNKVAGTTFKVPVDILALSTDATGRGDIVRNTRFVTAAFTRSIASFGEGAIICSGNAKVITSLRNAIVIVDGDFEGAAAITNSVIICRGSFKYTNLLNTSIVLCGGKFDAARTIDKSVIQAVSFRECTGTRNSVYINLPKVKAMFSEGDRYVTTKEDALEPSAFLS